MTHRPDRDAEFDRLLRRFAGPDAPSLSDPSASAGCLDAETVAAMADGGLLPHEQAAAMAHASTCDRCQAVLAAVIRTMPEPEPARAWWRLPALRWLTPVVATGVAVAVWVAVGTRPPAVTSTSVPVEAPAPAQASKAPAIAPNADQRQAGAVADASRPAAAAPESRRERAKASVRVDQLSAARLKDEASLDKEVAAKPSSEPVAAAPPPASPVLPAPVPPAPAAQTASSNVAAPAGAAGGAGRSGAANQSRAFADRAAVGAVAERAFAATDILSSDPRARWRIVGPTVQRSTDGGVTWLDQTTGTTVRLTAGSAPQPDVCWIVGDAGTVLLSIDGLSWRRLTPPVQATFVAVNATSADAATVTAGDGRIYVTVDRGRTWQPR